MSPLNNEPISKEETTINIVVFNWETWIAFSKSDNFPSDLANVVFWTAAPDLYEFLSKSHNVKDPTEGISQDDYNCWGDAINDLTQDWILAIDQAVSAAGIDATLGRSLNRTLLQTLISVVYYARLLDTCFSANDKVVIPYLEEQREAIFDFGRKPGGFSTIGKNFFAILKARGYLNNNFELLPVLAQGDCLATSNPQEEIKIGFTQWFRRTVITLIGFNVSLFQIRLLRFVQRPTIRKLLTNIYRKEVIILSPSPLYMSSIARLLLSGTYIRQLDLNIKPAVPNKGSFLEVADTLKQINKNIPPNLGWMKGALNISAEIIEDLLNHNIIPYYRAAKEVVTSEQNKIVSEGRKRELVVFTNGMFVPWDIIVAGIFRKLGTPIISFQHGATGLSKIYIKAQKFSDMCFCDNYAAFTEYETQFHREHIKDYVPNFLVLGSHRVQASRFGFLGRLLIRKMWGIKRREKLILFVPTKFRNSYLYSPYSHQDIPYWKYLKRIVQSAFKRTDAICVVKPYQKGVTIRPNDGMGASRNVYSQIEIPQNVHIETAPDFRFSRFAADIVVIDSATSTLGWALHCGVPLVFIEFPFTPLLPEIRDMMKQSLFLIDATSENWEETLVEVLNQPKSVIEARWEAMAQQRNEFVKHYVIGPETTNSAFVQWVNQTPSRGANNIV